MTTVSHSLPGELKSIVHDLSAETIGRYEKNVSALHRRIDGLVRPRSVEEVQKLVRVARHHRIPLYPISTGANWGLGSRLPVVDGGLIVDLSEMRRIHAVDPTFGYAVIEPGVTQRQLYERLQAERIPFFLNVTGSGADTSILGNALDRGIAHHGPRVAEVSCLEVVTGTGEIIKTAGSHAPSSRTAHLYPHGVGPSLDGLFFQSSFGIVVKATLALRPRKAHEVTLTCAVDGPTGLAGLVDCARKMQQEGSLITSIHISNGARSRSVLGGSLGRAARVPFHPHAGLAEERWSLVTTVHGPRAVVAASVRAASKQLAEIGRVEVTSEALRRKKRRLYQAARMTEWGRRGLLELDAKEPAFAHGRGIPSDVALASVPYAAGVDADDASADLDQVRVGCLFVLPLIPLEGSATLEAMTLTYDILATRHGLVPFVTLNSASPSSLEAVINVVFRREPKEEARAQRAVAELSKAFLSRGFQLYRVGIQGMADVTASGADYWEWISRLKRVFDPDGIIAPGRYVRLS